MIYAKTGMERMPEGCVDCELLRTCKISTGLESDLYVRPDGLCPLTEIDETLPAQLAAAEARCARLWRILDGIE